MTTGKPIIPFPTNSIGIHSDASDGPLEQNVAQIRHIRADFFLEFSKEDTKDVTLKMIIGRPWRIRKVAVAGLNVIIHFAFDRCVTTRIAKY